MGTPDNIIPKKALICLKCGKPMIYPMGKIIEVQSKQITNSMSKFKEGEPIIFSMYGLDFKCIGNEIAEGCICCYNCKAFFRLDIIIKEGIIKEFKNLKKKTFD